MIAARLVIAAMAAALVLLAPARPAAADAPPPPSHIALPVVIEAGGITVRAEAGLGDLAASIAERAPETLARIQADLPDLAQPDHVDIRLVKVSSDLAAAAPPGRGAPEWAAGVAYPDAGVVVVATRRDAHGIDVAGTVDHELAHMALGAALEGRAPRWLDEGFAYLHSSEWSFERTRTLTGMAWFGNVIPLAELEQRFPPGENAAGRAYAQSYDFVAFLAQRGRYADPHDDGDRWAFRDFLRAIAEGGDAWSAARNVYGASLDELFAEWKHTLKQRYMLLPAGLFALGVWVIGAIILVLAYLRKRRLARATLARWAAEEEAAGAEDALR